VDAVNAPDAYRISLAAYVLGALDGSERAELEAHLVGCAACQDELVHLAGLPGLLRQLSLDDVGGASAEPMQTDGLSERALAQMRRFQRSRQRRQRTLVLSAAAALIAVLVTGSFATGMVGPGWFSQGVTVTASDASTHIGASVRMKDESAGTELALTLWGVPEKQRCMLVAIGRDGTRETTSTWIASYSGKATVEGYTSLPSSDMRSLEVSTPDGKRLLSIPVHE
jgi:Putative zinc-finger